MDKIEALKQYKELLDSGILTQEEFDAKKKQILETPDIIETKNDETKNDETNSVETNNSFDVVIQSAKEKTDQAGPLSS